MQEENDQGTLAVQTRNIDKNHHTDLLEKEMFKETIKSFRGGASGTNSLPDLATDRRRRLTPIQTVQSDANAQLAEIIRHLGDHFTPFSLRHQGLKNN